MKALSLKSDLPNRSVPARASPRPRDRPAPQSGIRLEERDISLLTDLFLWEVMLRGHLQTLFFGSVGRTNARLRQLFDWQFVARTYLPIGPFGTDAGATAGCQAVYTLGKAGIPIVADRLGWDVAAVRERQRRGTPTHLLHALDGVAFRLALEAACRGCEEITQLHVLPEMLSRRSFDVRENGGRWRAQVFKPDLVVVLAQSAAPVGYAVEIDRGHTSQSEFAHKLRIHAAAMQGTRGSLFAGWHSCAPGGTLIITTSPSRRDNLRQLAFREGREGCRFTTFGALYDKGALQPIWHAPIDSMPVTLL